MSAYQSYTEIELRQSECARLKRKYPGYIPLVVESTNHDRALVVAIPRDTTVAELERIVRQAFGVYGVPVTVTTQGAVPAKSALLLELHERLGEEDGFLYMTWSSDTCMGKDEGGCMPTGQSGVTC